MKLKVVLFLLLLTSSLLVACDAGPESAEPERPDRVPVESSEEEVGPVEVLFEEYDCPIELPRKAKVTCGYLTVPENREREDSGAIDLAVAILHADKEKKALADPVVYLAGGPGGSALDDFAADVEGWMDYSFHRDRDIIFIDQRGTGYSLPSLDCPELAEMDDEEDAEYRALQECHDRLVFMGVDIPAYNTIENAADVADLRRALGHEEWNVLAVSYGTRLALTLMRDHPEGIRSVILDSPFPPNADLPVDEALTSMEAFAVLFEGCAQARKCNKAYPDLEAVLLETVARLNEEPDVVTLTDEYDEEYDQEVYGDDLVNALVQALYDAELIPLLPRVIYEVSEGTYDAYSVIAGGDWGWGPRFQGEDDEEELEDVSDSEGMYHIVTCRDEYAFADRDRTSDEARDAIPEELQSAMVGAVESEFDTCDIWQAGRAPDIENEPVASDLPTMIMVGQYDPVTPPRWAYLTAETLEQAAVFEFPGFGHALVNGGECPLDMIQAFLDDPTDFPDASCIDDLGGPDFYLPDDELDFE